VNHHKMTFVIFVMKICVRDMSQIANHNKFDFDFVFLLKKFRMFVTYEMVPKFLTLIK